MESKPEFGPWEVVGAALVTMIMVMVTIRIAGWNNDEITAAWVQAVGTILALFLTGGLAWWESRQRRIEARERGRNALLVRIAVLDVISSQISFYLACARERDKSLVPLASLVANIRVALEAALAVELKDMPTPLAVLHMAGIHVQVTRVLAVLNEYGAEAPPPPALQELKEVPQIIQMCVAQIKQDAQHAIL